MLSKRGHLSERWKNQKGGGRRERETHTHTHTDRERERQTETEFCKIFEENCTRM